jgi:2-isopropylmalate synthase
MLNAETKGSEEPQQIYLFDTTLRDGEQAPGNSMTKEEKLEIAQKIADSGEEVIEGGFPIASQGDFEGVKAIADVIGSIRDDVIICALARALPPDIIRAGEALKNAKRNRIHTFMGTTEDRLEEQYKGMSHGKALKKIREAVRIAKDNAMEVEFSAEDATRTERKFLFDVYDTAVDEGATILNIPDTVAAFDTDDYAQLIAELVKTYGPEIVISTHCHNDFGLATANTWAGIKNGARQVHVTINGIGERAGNASLQEVSNLIAVMGDGKYITRFDRRHNRKLSETLVRITGIKPQPNCAIAGQNAFAHESGIHQDGWLKKRSIYEVIHPEDNGYDIIDALVLGKHSGQAAVKEKTRAMGIILTDDQVQLLTKKIKDWCDNNPRKRGVTTDELLIMIAKDPGLQTESAYQFDNYTSHKNGAGCCVMVRMNVNGKQAAAENTMDSVIDAGIGTIRSIIGAEKVHFDHYLVHAQGRDEGAIALVSLELWHEDRPEERVTAFACDPDSNKAAMLCFINGVNQLGNRQTYLSTKPPAK